ncbi:MAG: hypothetical protein WBC33_07365 [Conexibacter sp.]
MPGQDGSSRAVTVALQLLGALAGLAALTTFAGGAMLWIRFNELHLPADQAVTLLPKQLLLTVGAHALLGPVAAGLLAGIVLLPAAQLRGTPRAWVFWVLLGGTLLVLVLVTRSLVSSFDLFPEQFFMTLTLLGAIGIVVLVAIASTRRSPVAWTIVIAFAVCGAVLAVVRTSGAPKLEPVAVLLDGRPGSVAGFYIGQTSDRLYVAPLPGSGDPGDPFADADIDRIAEIDRTKVLALVMREPTGIRSDEPGRDEAQSLLADLRLATSDPAEVATQPITTSDPVTAFAPLVNLHVRERSWPMQAEAFLADAWLVWVREGCPAAIQGKGDDDVVQAKRVTDHPELLGAFDPQRLAGPDPYTHRAAGEDCRGGSGPPIPTSAHTRPWDTRERPPGLGTHEGWTLDLRDGARTPKPDIRDEGPQRFLHGAPVYYELHGEGADTVRITYWFFYALSQPPGPRDATKHLVHEGDWERISVRLRKGARADQYVPLSVRYHAHDGSRDVAWAAVKRVAVGTATTTTHPVAYSARGSHATYWRAGSYENVFALGGTRAFAVHDAAIACPDCPQWRTWEQLVDARTQPWYGFGGAWGAAEWIAGGGTTGPLGPSVYKTGGLSPSPTETLQRAQAPTAAPSSSR